MVTMLKTKHLSLVALDVLGGSLVMACAVGFIWLVAVGSDRTSEEMTQLRQRIGHARRDLEALNLAQVQQQAVLKENEEKLAKGGRLPIHAPVEEYFRSLSAMAAQHHIRVLGHRPLASRRYPGLVEQLYAYEVTGSTGDIVRFLKAIEDAEFWADVSYLKVDGHGAADVHAGFDPRGASEIRRAALTISLFSAPPQEPSSETEDT